MEHAILIVDMPESINGEVPCKHCSLHVAEYDDYYHHYVCQSIRTNISADEWEIYKNCPLKPYQKAIPIEWMKKFANERALNDGMDCYWHFWGEDLLQMIEQWEKENA